MSSVSRRTPLTPATPDSSVSTESTIELKMSMSIQTTSPPNPPSWCRAEHATKEKHRRERIKDSCDQLRVLLPYSAGPEDGHGVHPGDDGRLPEDRQQQAAHRVPRARESRGPPLVLLVSSMATLTRIEWRRRCWSLMTKSGGPNACPSVRTPISGGRGSRGGRGGAAGATANRRPGPSPFPRHRYPSRELPVCKYAESDNSCSGTTYHGLHLCLPLLEAEVFPAGARPQTRRADNKHDALPCPDSKPLSVL
ncbi:hypothetical protein BaRGS_00021476 [Batillaria attramentaria]|uniref:BHLH domain-containing protein n=1 Tax=Batillaria attramentaria TaxID=370345 RepID=A0ABD0KJR1_9CAEN